MKISRKYNIILALVIVILFITIAYATLSTNLMINGSSKINNSTWNVYWDNLHVSDGSISLDSNDNTLYPAIINTSDNTRVEYSIELGEPGTFYEFTVDAKNDGSIDAMIDTISSTIKIDNGEVQNINSDTLPSWLKYSVTYSDGMPLAKYQKLDHKTSEKYKVRIEFKKDITSGQLISAVGKVLSFSFSVKYTQKDGNAISEIHPTSFSTDSWNTIVSAVKVGNTSLYTVGSTKSIDIGSHTYTLRVSNNSTPEECKTTGFSQTACGFVLEFVDIIGKHMMNPSGDTSINGYYNKGGWEYSEMRTYLNNNIYNSLPSTLKNGIINTIVVSGYGANDSSNFVTTDKLYLLSTHEVYKDVDNNVNDGIDYYDTAYYNTRQLDYYKNNNVTTASTFQLIIKQFENSGYQWWLRSAYFDNTTHFFRINASSHWTSYDSYNNGGVSPAFRLG